MYIISQILAFISFVISLFAYHKKNKKNILFYMIISNTFNFFHYLLLKGYSACITKVLAIIRDIVVINKNKWLNSKIFLFIFILIYTFFSFLTYQNIYSLLPLLAALLYMMIIWDGNELQIKKISYITYIIWLIYNICIFSLVGVISNILSIISSYLAYMNYKKSCN